MSQTPPRVVDFLSSVCGIRLDEQDRMCKRAPFFSGVRVIDPLFLFQSKCHCLLHLDQTDRQDARHVRMLALILPEYFSSLIDNVLSQAKAETAVSAGGELASEGPQEFKERDVLKELKLLKKILRTHACRRALKQLEIDPNTLLPWSKMKDSGLELLAVYALGPR